MTLFMTRVRVEDVQQLERNSSERHALKAAFGCTGSRFLVDSENENSALVLMDFPSLELAREYGNTTTSVERDTPLVAMTVISAEYFEDVTSAKVTAGLSEGAAVSPIVA